MASLDERRWRHLWKRLCVRGDASAPFAQLIAAYSEPHRAYHNAAHVADCLRQFDLVQTLAKRPDEVEAAIWFHDAVYDPRAADNEERSAAWAARVLEVGGADPEAVRRVADLIRATKHDRPPATADAALLLDVDLSILGREPEVFAAYDRAIREEYRWVPEADYRAGRARVLDNFLSRPTIYHTEAGRARWEAQARLNLERAVSRLTVGPG